VGLQAIRVLGILFYRYISEKLTDDNIAKIVAAYERRETSEYFTCLVPNAEIAEQSYNLSVSIYVAQEDKREGVGREDELRRAIDEIIKELAV
jgi:type I restriction enzyme M protein